MARLTDRPDMTLDVYRGRKTTIQQQQQQLKWKAKYDFTLTIHFNAISIKLITLLYTKRAEAKQLGSGEPRVNQIYFANPCPFAIYFTCLISSYVRLLNI